MSSNAYSAELCPEPHLRRAVLCSGVLLYLAGNLLVALLPLAMGWKLAIGLAWLAICSYEWLSNWLAYARGGILRFDSDGGISHRSPQGQWEPAKLAPGSVVTLRLAWIRISTGRRRRYGELFCGNARESEDWRRFRVIWRHIGAA